MLASLLFPYDDDAPSLIDSWLSELQEENCIIQYESEGQHYIQIVNWLQHQKIDKPSKSYIPPFDESSRILASPRERSSEDLGPRTKDLGMDLGEEPVIFEKTKKPERHEYGSEKNVLLTDSQYSKLLADLGADLAAACIEELSQAKAMKGYKYKRDDLAIRRWVVDKVKRDKPEIFQARSGPRLDPSPLSSPDPEIMAMIERNYAKDKQDD